MTEQLPAQKQTSYSLVALADLAGISPKRLRKVLGSVGIKGRRASGRYVIFVTDIEARLPELWASILICERVRAEATAEFERGQSDR